MPATNALALGLTRSAYWLRLTLHNPGNQSLARRLVVDNPRISHIQAHLPDGRGSYRVASTVSLLVPLQLWTPEAFHAYERNDYLVQAWYFGMATAMVLFMRHMLHTGHILPRVDKLLLELCVAQRTDELQALNARLHALSQTDGLTGIANRRRFDEVLALEWKRAQRLGQPLAVLMLDVDWFKKYNDHHGHPMGDACLQQIARTLAATVSVGVACGAQPGRAGGGQPRHRV